MKENVPNILQRIVTQKRYEVIEQSIVRPLATLQATLAESPPLLRGFAATLAARIRTGQPGVIAEIKRASPSKGLICENFIPEHIARSYAQGGAACLSVLTDEQFFQGSFAYLAAARAACTLPVLRKDFIIDPYQVYQSRVMGADAILLIAACLNDNELHSLADLARELGLDILLEVHNENELHRALAVEPNILGINNRDLSTFEVDIKTTIKLLPEVPKNYLLVTESGINSSQDVELLWQHGISGFLVGETLMRAADPGLRLAELFGLEN
ncbi:indole-3-glycerol-phosphate synthase [Achromatium sp. WMS2]|nr:indole-3-glycerol-phosphate synthase [Achromatium sp. WMS2]